MKKSVADEIALILPGIVSTMLKELNVTKPIASSIDTLTSVTISTITEEGNTIAMPNDSTAKDVSDDNTNTTATSSRDFMSDSSSNKVNETNEIEETSMPLQPRKNQMLSQK
eukprot:5288533-Ditylum_brightwellii.AAC.1